MAVLRKTAKDKPARPTFMQVSHISAVGSSSWGKSRVIKENGLAR